MSVIISIWDVLILNPMFYLLCFIIVPIITFFAALIYTQFTPKDIIFLLKKSRELKYLTIHAKDRLSHTGFITKIAFRILNKSAERYFP